MDSDERAEILALLRDISDRLARLEAAWQLYQPVAEAFGRGGLLAARAAARNGRRERV